MILKYSDIGQVPLEVPENLNPRELKHLGVFLCALCSDENLSYGDLISLIDGLTPLEERTELAKLAYITIVARRYIKKGTISSERLTKLLPMVPRGLIVPAGKYYSIKNLGLKRYFKYLVESVHLFK